MNGWGVLIRHRLFRLAAGIVFSWTAIVTAYADGSEFGTTKRGFWKRLHDFFLPHTEENTVIFSAETEYHQVRIEETGNGIRHLVFLPRRGSQGIWNPQEPNSLVSNYLKTACLFLAASPTLPKNALFVGLGAGILPTFLANHFPDTDIDIVEIDPQIPEIAKKHFHFKESEKVRVTIGDGRVFLKGSKKKYDIIFLDAYNADGIPFHLTTVEFMQLVRERLSDHGVALANIAAVRRPWFTASEIATLRSVFPHVTVFTCPNRSNYVPIATIRDQLRNDAMRSRAEAIDAEYGLGFRLADFLDFRMASSEIDELCDEEDATILTDAFAPVE
jgi:spermidine synthase